MSAEMLGSRRGEARRGCGLARHGTAWFMVLGRARHGEAGRGKARHGSRRGKAGLGMARRGMEPLLTEGLNK